MVKTIGFRVILSGFILEIFGNYLYSLNICKVGTIVVPVSLGP